MCAHSYSQGRNDVRLMSRIDGEDCSHFRLREFENREGLTMVNASVLDSLELVRRELTSMAGETVWVIVTDALRTESDLARLAERLGWTDEGGAVSRNSKHLAKFGGIAVDVVAVVASTRRRVPQESVGGVCRKFFSWVKDDYGDGHVHADNRGVLVG